MFLKPQLKKLRKERRGNLKGVKFDGLHFGTFGIKSLSVGKLTAKQIETCRRIISKKIKGIGKLWIRVFPFTPITAKAKASRMGKGKGGISFWVCNILPGKMLYEMDGIPFSMATDIVKTLSYKLHLKLVLVS